MGQSSAKSSRRVVCPRPAAAMADQSDTPERAPASAPEPAGSPQPQRRHRALVWSLIVLASVLLIVSMTANWVQRAALDTNQVVNTTDEILADQDVQQALSIYLVDQLYANVDVQGQIEKELPSSAKALSAPVAAATRQLALNVSEKALASPRVQALVSTRRPRDARAVREADRGQGPVRLDHRRRRHARVRKPRRRPGRPPGGGPGDDLPDPGRRAGPLEGPQARPDHGSGPDQVGARRTRSGAGRLAEPPAATESGDARRRRSPSSRRRSRASRRRSRARRARPRPSSRAAWPSSTPGCPTSTAG